MPPPPRAASPPLGSHSTPIVGHQTLGAPHKAPSTLLSFAVQSRAAKEEEEGGLKEAVQSRDAWLLVPNGVGGSGGSFAGIPPGRSPRKGCAPISPTLQESSSLNPRQTNDASSNKPRYHDINNIYFQAKPQPGLLIPVIKANGSSVISFASPQAAPYVLISAFILSHRVPPGGDHPDPHALCHIPGAMCYGPSPEQSSPRARSERQTAAFNLVRSTMPVLEPGIDARGQRGPPAPQLPQTPSPEQGNADPGSQPLTWPVPARLGSAQRGSPAALRSSAEAARGGDTAGAAPQRCPPRGRASGSPLPAFPSPTPSPPPVPIPSPPTTLFPSSIPHSHPYLSRCSRFPSPIPHLHLSLYPSPIPSLGVFQQLSTPQTTLSPQLPHQNLPTHTRGLDVGHGLPLRTTPIIPNPAASHRVSAPCMEV